MELRRIFTFYLANTAHKELKTIAFHTGRTVADLLREGSQLVIKKQSGKKQEN